MVEYVLEINAVLIICNSMLESCRNGHVENCTNNSVTSILFVLVIIGIVSAKRIFPFSEADGALILSSLVHVTLTALINEDVEI